MRILNNCQNKAKDQKNEVTKKNGRGKVVWGLIVAVLLATPLTMPVSEVKAEQEGQQIKKINEYQAEMTARELLEQASHQEARVFSQGGVKFTFGNGMQPSAVTVSAPAKSQGPKITSISANNRNGSIRLIIDGVRFGSGTTMVTVLNKTYVAKTTTDTQVIVDVPSNGLCTGTVLVTVQARTGQVSGQFRFIAPNAPVIKSINPSSASSGGTISVQAENCGCSSLDNKVSVAGKGASVLAVSGNTLMVQLPSGLAAGANTVNLQVGNLSGQSTLQIGSSNGGGGNGGSVPATLSYSVSLDQARNAGFGPLFKALEDIRIPDPVSGLSEKALEVVAGGRHFAVVGVPYQGRAIQATLTISIGRSNAIPGQNFPNPTPLPFTHALLRMPLDPNQPLNMAFNPPTWGVSALLATTGNNGDANGKIYSNSRAFAQGGVTQYQINPKIPGAASLGFTCNVVAPDLGVYSFYGQNMRNLGLPLNLTISVKVSNINNRIPNSKWNFIDVTITDDFTGQSVTTTNVPVISDTLGVNEALPQI
jgi:hypothetical protein